jgi:hypothetical protein
MEGASPAEWWQIVCMDTYTIEPDGASGFQVRQTHGDGGNGHITTGFSSREAAQVWIDDHRASMAAAERWAGTAPGYQVRD